MLNDEHIRIPQHYQTIQEESETLKFKMLSDLKTGALLRTLAASKPGGNMLELGTGTGLSLAWIAEGADKQATITSVDNDATFQQVARKIFAQDPRITFHCMDGNEWLLTNQEKKFDLVFADAWPGKFDNLDIALEMVNVGGFYVIDDLNAQPNWPDGHQSNVNQLTRTLEQKKNVVFTSFNWSTGLMVLTRIS